MCARGILLSDLSLDLVRSEITVANEQTWPDIMQRFNTMQTNGNAWLDSEKVAADRRRLARVVEARYKGQNHEVQVRLVYGVSLSPISCSRSRRRISANMVTLSPIVRSRW